VTKEELKAAINKLRTRQNEDESSEIKQAQDSINLESFPSSKDAVKRLKEIRKRCGMTYQDIVDATEAAGQAVSMSTVKRVFGPESDKYEYRYETTIQPIAAVLLEADGLKKRTAGFGHIEAVIDAQNELIDSLREEIEINRSALVHERRMVAIMSASILVLLVIGVMLCFGINCSFA
jgi:hypothetical protein